MKIKRYEGKSEQAIIQRVKEELGLSAIILSIKRKPYRGLLSLFKSPVLVVTAAYEDKPSPEKRREEKLNADKRALQEQAQLFLSSRSGGTQDTSESEDEPEAPNAFLKEVQMADQQQRISSLENKLTATEELLARAVSQLNVAEQMTRIFNARKYDNNLIQLFYESMVEQGVNPEIAEKLLDQVDVIDEREEVNMGLIVRVVYNTILDILGQPNAIEIDPRMEESQVIAFMGPTGVGKTTTIAKLSSLLALKHNVRVGLITADTYRIAAVEQLRTYAEILGLDLQVLYNVEEIETNLATLRTMNDVILIDTAGRSHRSEENLTELKALLSLIPDCKRYLVLSITAKLEDLLSIVNTYTAFTDFELIFTKLDETETLGSILNICYLTGKKVSYVTFGQNVPEDIEIIQPDMITRALLGLRSAHRGGN